MRESYTLQTRLGTFKEHIPLENYFLRRDLNAEIRAVVDRCNHRRCHESLGSLTPVDVCFERGQTALLKREKVKRRSIERRRLEQK